jgi:uncharacterized DUF497 family protein
VRGSLDGHRGGALGKQVYIADIDCSAKVLEKINSKHGVSLHEVYEAVMYPARLTRATWVYDVERGSRLAAEGVTLSGRVVRVVLYPVDEQDGTWRLGTAVPLV